jgi:hypothetical protein
MTELEYRTQLAEMRKRQNDEVRALKIKYANSNAKFKKGDIIKHKNAGFVIQIEKIVFIPLTFSSDLPTVMYEGYEVKSDLTPKRNAKCQEIFQDSAELVKKG